MRKRSTTLSRTNRLGRSKKPKAKLVREADALWSQLVKDRAKGICELCGKPGQDAHHMNSRRSHFTRWDARNGVFLCKGCHLRFHSRESYSCWEWFEKTRPEDWRWVVENLHTVAEKSTLETALRNLKAWRDKDDPFYWDGDA